MPFQSVPNAVEIIILGLIGGQQTVNTHYGQHTGAYVQADLDELSNAVDAWVAASWLPLMPSNWSYVRTEVRGLTNAIDLISVNNTNAGPGTAAATPFSNNASIAVKRASSHTGRGARGRIFIPPPTADGLADDNHITDLFAASLTGALDALTAAMATTNFVAVIVHRVDAGIPLVPAAVFTIAEWVVVDLVIDSMRRRLPGRGV